VKRVQQHSNEVISIGGFPLAQMRANLPGLVFAHEYKIDIFLVVREVDSGRFANRQTVVGISLDKIGNLKCNGKVRRRVEIVFEFWRLGDARDGDWSRRSPRCRRLWLRRCGLRQCEAAYRTQGQAARTREYPL
jgi:hypothetical protein